MSNTETGRDIVIVSTARTPIGKFGGALVGSSAVDIGGQSIAAAIERSGISPEA